ncbi:MAG: hypothetical protein AB7O66_18760 [Limisphaerales bacterium]
MANPVFDPPRSRALSRAAAAAAPPRTKPSAGPWTALLFRLGLGVACLVAAQGCRTYSTKTESVRAAWAAGQVDTALREFSSRVAKSGDGRDGVVWRLEEATALRAAGRFEDSSRAFEAAEARMAEYANRAKIRVGNEAMSAITTPANLPYEGRSYDRILAATYRALNAIALGRPDQARPALIKAYQYQQDAVAENARRIERAQADARDSAHSDTVQRTESNPQFQRQVDSLYKPVAELRPYAEYVNPFTTWLDGVFFLAQAQDYSDLERARKSLERTLAFAPDNPYVRADLDAADRRLKGAPPEPVTYVVFESGLSVIRQQVRIDIPIVFANVSYIGSAWPVLQPRGGNALTLAATAGGGRFNTAPVGSVDSVIARDFEDEKPAIISRTLASTLAKGAAAFAANEAASQADEGLGALIRVATLAYQASVNIADTRSWTTLPKEFQIARVPTPPDRRLQILEGNQAPVVVTVEEGLVHFVYVRSVGGNRPLQVIHSRLK